jgi:hypothetical protein
MSTGQVAPQAAASTAQQELNVLFPDDGKMTVAGEEITIRPFKFRQIKALLGLAEKFQGRQLPEAFLDGEGKLVKPEASKFTFGELVKLVNANKEVVTEAIAIAAGKDNNWVDDLDQDVLIKLLALIYKVNVDFFTTQVLPLLEPLLAGQPKLKEVLGGLKS